MLTRCSSDAHQSPGLLCDWQARAEHVARSQKEAAERLRRQRAAGARAAAEQAALEEEEAEARRVGALEKVEARKRAELYEAPKVNPAGFNPPALRTAHP